MPRSEQKQRGANTHYFRDLSEKRAVVGHALLSSARHKLIAWALLVACQRALVVKSKSPCALRLAIHIHIHIHTEHRHRFGSDKFILLSPGTQAPCLTAHLFAALRCAIAMCYVSMCPYVRMLCALCCSLQLQLLAAEYDRWKRICILLYCSLHCRQCTADQA